MPDPETEELSSDRTRELIAAGRADEAFASLYDFGRLYERLRAAGKGGVAGLLEDAEAVAAMPHLSPAARERLAALRNLLHTHAESMTGPVAAHLQLLTNAWAWVDDLPGLGLREWLAAEGPDGRWLRILDDSAGRGAPRLPSTGHDPAMTAVIDPPSGRIVSACTSSLRTWSLDSGRLLQVMSRPFQPPRDEAVRLLLLRRADRTLALWARRLHFEVWDLDSGTLVSEYDVDPLPKWLRWMWLLDGGERLLVANEGEARVLETVSGACVRRWSWAASADKVFPLAGGRQVVAFRIYSAKAWVYEVESGELRAEQPPLESCNDLWPAPDGRRVVVQHSDRRSRYCAELWDFEANRSLGRTNTLSGLLVVLFGNDGEPVWSPDGRSLYFGSSKIELEPLKLSTWRVQDYISPLAFLPDGRRLVGLLEGRVMVLDAQSGERLASCGEAWTGAAILPDGRIAVFGWQGLYLWDPVSDPRHEARPVLPAEPHKQGTTVLAGRPGKRQIEVDFEHTETHCMGDTEVTERLTLVVRDHRGVVRHELGLPTYWHLETDGRYLVVPGWCGLAIVSVGSWQSIAGWRLGAPLLRARCEGARVELAADYGAVLRFEVMGPHPWPTPPEADPEEE